MVEIKRTELMGYDTFTINHLLYAHPALTLLLKLLLKSMLKGGTAPIRFGCSVIREVYEQVH